MQDQSAYLISILKFAGIPILLQWLIGYKYLSKYIRKILLMGAIGILFTPFIDGTGIRIGAWSYYPNASFNTLLFGAEIETYVFSFLVAIVVASSTIYLIEVSKNRR